MVNHGEALGLLLLGLLLGMSFGLSLGLSDGEPLGDALGLSLSDVDGELLGTTPEGEALGEPDGLKLREALSLGTYDCTSDGACSNVRCFKISNFATNVCLSLVF